MRTLLCMLIALALARFACADTVVLDERFDGPAGMMIDGWNGWTGDAGIVISGIVVDQGNSAAWAGEKEWPVVAKSFSYTPAESEEFVLTAALSAPDAKGAYSEIRLATNVTKKANHVGAQLGYRELIFQRDNACDGTEIRVPQTAATMDVRLVVSTSAIECFYRNHGESAWMHAGSLKGLHTISSYNVVTIAGGTAAGRSGGGNIDSIRLLATSNKR